MPTTYAYVRISDAHKQDSATQRQRIADYARQHAIIIDNWQEYHLSGSKTGRAERGIDQLLATIKAGDHLLISDIDRLGRTTISDIVEIVTRIINTGASLHICYSGQQLTPADTNDLAKIFITLGEAYAAVKFSQERSYKAKAAISRRKGQGLHNGRPHGAIISSKLDDHEATIVNLAAQNYSEYAIAKYLQTHRSTLRRWKENRLKIIQEAKDSGLWKPHQTLKHIKLLLKNFRKT